jgi:hypothetical protein
MIGVTCGAPLEFRSRGALVEGDLPGLSDFSPEQVEGALTQDDLYVGVTFAQVMDDAGLDATTAQYGDALRETRYDLWHANAAARRLLAQGIPADRAGDGLYNLHANDIDFQIDADFIGLMCPGLPASANRYAIPVGRLVARGDGLYGGLYVASLYAAAFFERDPARIVAAALRSLPAESGYAAAVRDVIRWHAEIPSFRDTWRRIEARWAKDDACPSGALEPFDIDARLNGAYVTLGLLYGKGDVERTLEITLRAGQDTDSNAATALGVLGTALGWSGIPARWKAGIPAIAGRAFAGTRLSLDDLVVSTRRRALAVVERAGGAVEGDVVIVPEEAPAPPPFEPFDMGVPTKRLEAGLGAWTWRGAVQRTEGRIDAGRLWHGVEVSLPGSEAELRFEGSAVAVVGPLGTDGGRADVYVDGQKQDRLLDAYAPLRTWDHDLWHTLGLADGPHTLRIVLRGDQSPPSTGTRVAVYGAVAFRPSSAP